MKKSFIISLWDFAKTFAVAAFVAFFLIRGFVFEPFKIPSRSMVPTLVVGDFLFVSKYSYGNRLPLTNYFFWQTNPVRGDIAVFKNPYSNLPGSFFGFGVPMFIKRIIALPGDTIEYKSKQLFINDETVSLDLVNDNHSAGVEYMERFADIKHSIILKKNAPSIDVSEVIVPENMFVVMGDNRDNSLDSRYWSHPNWGFVPRHNLMGRAEFIFWSWDKNWKPRFKRLGESLHPLKDYLK